MPPAEQKLFLTLYVLAASVVTGSLMWNSVADTPPITNEDQTHQQNFLRKYNNALWSGCRPQ